MKKYKVTINYSGPFPSDERLKQCEEFESEFEFKELYEMDWTVIITYYIISEDDLLMIRFRYSLSTEFLICVEST